MVEYIAKKLALSYVAEAPTVYAALPPVAEYARGGVHRTRDCHIRDTSTRGRVHHASTSRLLQDNSCVRCGTTSGGVRRASVVRIFCGTSSTCIFCASTISGARFASASRVLRGNSSVHVQCSSVNVGWIISRQRQPYPSCRQRQQLRAQRQNEQCSLHRRQQSRMQRQRQQCSLQKRQQSRMQRQRQR